jgi:hypothetical protein
LRGEEEEKRESGGGRRGESAPHTHSITQHHTHSTPQPPYKAAPHNLLTKFLIISSLPSLLLTLKSYNNHFKAFT